ncbi:peptidase inhibitor family I36 protein [Streptomyces violaceusniger]|uniref:peptidase inhibitor family I36 protein n=1 Tax=Streptomyces violaceusniger TaxID=68280 RepID=UPI003CD05AE4
MSLLAAGAPVAVPADARPAEIDCPDGYVCIYPEIGFGGQPWVKRAVDGSVKDLPSAIRDRGSSVTDRGPCGAMASTPRPHRGQLQGPEGGQRHLRPGFQMTTAPEHPGHAAAEPLPRHDLPTADRTPRRRRSPRPPSEPGRRVSGRNAVHQLLHSAGHADAGPRSGLPGRPACAGSSPRPTATSPVAERTWRWQAPDEASYRWLVRCRSARRTWSP